MDRAQADEQLCMHWYDKPSSGGQGVVLDEVTGRTIAVTYESKDAPLVAAAPTMRRALRQLYELRRIILARAGAAGHRQTSDGTWICDPWTQAFKDAGEALEQADTGQRPTGERGWV